MPVKREHDRLGRIFPNWELDQRDIAWLWMQCDFLSTHAMMRPPSSLEIRDTIATYLDRNPAKIEVMRRKRNTAIFLPENSFDWINRDGRQPAWLLKHYDRIRPSPPSTLGLSPIQLRSPPDYLSLKEKLIAYFDYVHSEKSQKKDFLAQLKEAWIQQLQRDSELAWYSSAGKEKGKLQIAWQWYQDHHSNVVRRTTPFQKLDDLLLFLDNTPFSFDEKLYHLEQIKKKFKAKEVAANRKGKQQTNLSLADDAREKLDSLAKKMRMTRTELVELLIETAYKDSTLG